MMLEQQCRADNNNDNDNDHGNGNDNDNDNGNDDIDIDNDNENDNENENENENDNDNVSYFVAFATLISNIVYVCCVSQCSICVCPYSLLELYLSESHQESCDINLYLQINGWLV